MPRTLGQERAEFALNRVIAFKNAHSNEQTKRKELKSLSASLPAMILQNGLGHTLSFLYSKGKDHHIELLNAIVEWLTENFNDFNNYGNVQGFIRRLTQVDQRVYLSAQQEALKMLEWYKRYANSGFLIEDNN